LAFVINDAATSDPLEWVHQFRTVFVVLTCLAEILQIAIELCICGVHWGIIIIGIGKLISKLFRTNAGAALGRGL